MKWRQIDHILLAAALLLLLLSLLWWPLRMLHADSAYMSWRLMQWEQMDAGRWRWLSYLTQCWPWLAVKANAPLAAVLAVYSFALQLPHTLVSFLAWKRRARGTALASILLSTLWMNSAWFIPVSEMHLAAAVLMLWWLYPKQGWLSALAWFTHPGIGPIALLMAVFPGEWTRRRNALLWLLPAIALKQIFADAYEQGFGTGLLQWNSLQDSYVFAYLARVWKTPAGLLTLALLPLSWFWVQRRTAFWQTLAIVLMLPALALIYRNGDSDVWMQKNLLPFSMALALPCWQLLDRHKKDSRPPRFAWLLLALLPLSAITLWEGQQGALQRLKNLQTLVRMQPGPGKWLIAENEALHRQLGAVWALPYESLLYSSWKDTGQQKTLLPFSGKPAIETTRPDLFIGAPFMPPLPVRALHPAYFQLPITAYRFTDSGKILR